MSLVSVGLAAFCLVGCFVYRAAQAEPEFYQEALTRSVPEEQAQHGADLERQLLELHNQAITEGRWEAILTDEQINGWLATDLPLKFPQLLPPGAKDPRVAIRDNRIQAACRYESSRINAVISLELEVELSDEPNTLSVRVAQVRAGRVPIPLAPFLERIAAVAKTTDVPFRWAKTEGDPVAMITIPKQHKDYLHREVYVESLELRDGELALAGHAVGPRRLAERSRWPSALTASHQGLANLTIHR